MAGELSHGLQVLATSGNRILRRDTDETIRLRGVNRSGLEYSQPTAAGFLDGAGITEDEIRAMTEDWKATVIRLPFNQDFALRGRNGHTAESYLSALDQAIDWAARGGAYTLLDLQWLDADTPFGNTGGKPNYVAPMPDPRTPELWRTLAKRYREEPAVLFDLFNEPHDPLDDDFHPIWVVTDDGRIESSDAMFAGAEEWNPWAALLVKEIRSVHPDSLIFVGGVDWAFDLHEVHVDAPGIVYSAHIYPNRKRGAWRKAFGKAAKVPVFLGEWGGHDEDLEFGRDLVDAMHRNAAGWAAWSWVDDPPLVQSPRPPDYRPTKFGELVRDELRTPLTS
jgi:endoglucanase